MAELLARIYGDTPRYPGAGDGVEMSDEERRLDQERAARWVNSERDRD